MNKADLITRIASLPDNHPLLIKMGNLLDNKPVESTTVTYGVCEAAKRVNVSRTTVFRAIKAGVLPAAPLIPGGRQRIRESDLLTWVGGS